MIMNNFSNLKAISPIDGRYRSKVSILENYFSEYALISYRVKVEILYLLKLPGFIPSHINIDANRIERITEITTKFDLKDAERVKAIEKSINHDVKAVEYFIKEKLKEIKADDLLEFVHFGLTSQDINNTGLPMGIRDALLMGIIPLIEQVIQELKAREYRWTNIAMVAHTHGQVASPTRLGKEIGVFVQRLKLQLEDLKKCRITGKFGGATGNFNAHYAAFPAVDWHAFAKEFLEEDLGIKRSFPTTQIEHYDYSAALFDGIKRINTILIDLCRDCWAYISMDYFTQNIIKGEVGSSAMPHKVNPIDFENAEGNLGIAIALFEHLSSKLPISRLQRDLSDSTVWRNVGIPFAHTMIALKSILKGLHKIEVNLNKIENDLDDNWAVLAEAVQTILRRERYPNAYEALKELTRTSGKISKEKIWGFVESLAIREDVKKELKALTPSTYLGR